MTSAVVPRPIALVSTIGQKAQPNVSPFSYFTVCSSNPPCLVFCPTTRGREATIKDTLRNIKDNGEFVVNIVSEDFVVAMNQTSGEYPPEVNEFELSKLTPIPSERIAPPRVAESKINFECKLRQIVTVSEAPGGGYLVLGEVVMLHIAEVVLADSANPFRVDANLLQAVGRMGGTSYVRTQDRFELERPKVTNAWGTK